jgi:hypothetical protein
MALVLSKDRPLRDFELAFKTAWARGNDDGVGIYWRDYPITNAEAFRHLARFGESRDLAKIGQSYDRLFIHFRNSTGGDGTHPFSCNHVPENESGNWFLAHNGVVQDTKARSRLKAKHKFSTEIDSEAMAHIWGDVDHKKPMPEQVKDFVEQIKKDEVTGWANLIFYNVVTDDWVVFCDGAIKLTAVKNLLVISSDTEWLDSSETDKNNVKVVSVEDGSVVYGNGATITTTLKDMWKKKYATEQTTFIKGTTVITTSHPEANQYNADNFEKTLAVVSTHDYVPTEDRMRGDDGELLCKICWMERGYHEAANTCNIDNNNNALVLPAKWREKHPFERDKNVKNGILCKCGLVSGFGPYHKSHAFKRVKKEGAEMYCWECGCARSIGNHIESGPAGHYFAPMKIVKMKDGVFERWIDSILCQRCSKTEEEHPMNQSSLPSMMGSSGISNDGHIIQHFIKPTKCSCDLNAHPVPLICRFHWKQGYRWAEDGYIKKKTRQDGTIITPEDERAEEEVQRLVNLSAFDRGELD